MMKVKIKHLLDAPTMSKALHLNNLAVDAGILCPAIVNGSLKLTYDPPRIKVKGALMCSLTLTCSRCTREFEEKIEVDIDETFEEESRSLASVKEVDWDRDSIKTFLLKEGAVDLQEVVRDNVIVSLPMKPLCSSDCPGIEIETEKGGETDGCTCKKGN